MMNTIKAVERACELVELLGCGEVVDGVMDVVAKEKAPRSSSSNPTRSTPCSARNSAKT